MVAGTLSADREDANTGEYLDAAWRPFAELAMPAYLAKSGAVGRSMPSSAITFVSGKPMPHGFQNIPMTMPA